MRGYFGIRDSPIRSDKCGRGTCFQRENGHFTLIFDDFSKNQSDFAQITLISGKIGCQILQFYCDLLLFPDKMSVKTGTGCIEPLTDRNVAGGFALIGVSF